MLILEKDVVVCCLKKHSAGKAQPISAHLESKCEERLSQWNNLNEINLPGSPAIFWVNRGYEVYSTLTDYDYWFQYCLSSKAKANKEKD